VVVKPTGLSLFEQFERRQREAHVREGRPERAEAAPAAAPLDANPAPGLPRGATAVRPGTLRLVIADDHGIVRQSLRLLLEKQGFAVLGEAADGAQAVELVREHQPDVAVLDISMPGTNGLEAVRQIRRIAPLTRTILLSMHTDERYVREAMNSGAQGYVLKSQAASDLILAIRAACRGEVYFGATIRAVTLAGRAGPEADAADRLSHRQRQVLQMVAEGKSTKGIAEALGISPKTAEAHRSALMRKLGAHRAAELVRSAVRLGLIEV
jgi:DNA-binding NarL/FixJ family response regulator